MSIVKINNIGAIGVIKDIPPHELPPEAWSGGQNIRFNVDSVQKMSGHEDVYNLSMSGAITVSQSVQVSPWYVLPVNGQTNNFWVYAGQQKIYTALSDSNDINITRYSTATASDIVYSATCNTRWNGAVLAGIPVLCPGNTGDPPQVWTPVAASTRLQNMQWDISASGGSPTTWDTRTAGAVTCRVFRTYREFGIALHTVEGGTEYPRRLRWSHPAVAHAQPTSWDEDRGDKDAGYKDFDETYDRIVDCLPLRDLNIIYKENTTWVQQYTGGNLVHQFRQLYPTVGALSTECAREFFGKHFVLTDGDVVVHNGVEVKSIIQRKWRNTLFNDIDSDYYENTFVTINYANHEVWICYPETGVSEPPWCTKALIWNWEFNTWTFRELPRTSFINWGVVETTPVNSYTWATIAGTWSSIGTSWGSRAYQPTDRAMLLASPNNYLDGAGGYTASAGLVAKLYKLDSTETFDGVTPTCQIERQGLGVASQDRTGKPVVDLENMKMVRRIWPHIQAATGTQIDIYVGYQNHLDEAVTYSGPFTYTVGTDNFVNCRIVGRYIAVKFVSNTTNTWKITGYDLDVDRMGFF